MIGIKEKFTVIGNNCLEPLCFGINNFSDGSQKVYLVDGDKVASYKSTKFTITAYPRNMDDIMVIGQMVDIIRRNSYVFITDITLELMTTMYSRYDRVMHSDRSDAFGLSVYASVLASLGITCIRTLDAHSEVFGYLIQSNGMKYEDIGVLQTAKEAVNPKAHFKRNYIVVAPDKGLKSKVGDFADVTCDKIRNPETGKISGVKVSDFGRYDSGDFTFNDIANHSARRFLIIDDICERGGTFFGVEKALREAGATAGIDLFVTHGVMPEGTNFEALLNTFDNVYVHTMQLGRYNEAKSACLFSDGNFHCKNIYA